MAKNSKLSATNPFIKYWDDVINQWLGGTIDPCQKQYGHLVNIAHMPEPYWGDPDNCSFVIVNYNPGGGQDRNPHTYYACVNCTNHIGLLSQYVKNNSYSQLAMDFPLLLDKSLLHHKTWITTYGGYQWWQAKKPWITHLAKAAKVATPDEGLMPFAIELCPWHNASWSNTQELYDNSHLKPVVKTYVSDVILAAIAASKAKFGYFIGRNHIPVLLTAGFVKIDPNPLQPILSSNRWFQRFEYKPTGLRAIVTWTLGSNKHPGNGFWAFEQTLIKKNIP